jgi:hypothetical protein
MAYDKDERLSRAHMRAADEYMRYGNIKKALAHTGRALHYGAPRFSWPEEVKREAFGLFLQGKTAALMFDEINRRALAITEAKGERHSLAKNTVEGWINGWYNRVIRGKTPLPVPIFSGEIGDYRVTEKELEAWEQAWHEGLHQLQPPYNIITGETNPRYVRRPSDANTARPGGPSGPFGLHDQERRMAAATLLGLDNFINPTEKEVSRARNNQLLKYHPDKLKHNTPEEEWSAINEKYKVIYQKLAEAANVFHPGKFSSFGSARIF